MATAACVRCGAERSGAARSCSRCGWSEPVAAAPARSGVGRRALLIGAGATVVLAAAGVTAALLVGGGDDGPSSPPDTRERDARDVAAALGRLADDPADLRATTATLSAVDLTKAVPGGSTVSPDRATWSPDGAGGGVMTVAVTTAGKSRRYQAVMVQESGAWKVLATFPVPSTSPTSPSPTGTSS